MFSSARIELNGYTTSVLTLVCILNEGNFRNTVGGEGYIGIIGGNRNRLTPFLLKIALSNLYAPRNPANREKKVHGASSRINLRRKYTFLRKTELILTGQGGGCMKGHTFCTYKKRIFFSGTETE